MRRRRLLRGNGLRSGAALPLRVVEFVTSATVHASETGFASNFSVTFDSDTAGADRLLLAVVVYETGGDPGITGMTYSGIPLTKAVEETVAPSDNFSETVEVWYVVAPETGSNTLAMTNSATSQDAALMAAVYAGTNQSTPIGPTATAARLLSDDGTVELEVPHRGAGFWAVAQDRGGDSGFTATEGGTLRREVVIGSASAGFVAACGEYRNGGGPVLVGATQTEAAGAAGEQDIVAVAVALIAAT